MAEESSIWNRKERQTLKREVGKRWYKRQKRVKRDRNWSFEVEGDQYRLGNKLAWSFLARVVPTTQSSSKGAGGGGITGYCIFLEKSG